MATKGLIQHLREQWERACNAYLLELANMFEWDVSETSHYGYWIANDVGALYAYGDCHVISMDDIRYCVENGISEREYAEYEEYNSAACSLGLETINLRAWHNGCPRLPKESIERRQDMKDELMKETERMKEELRNGKKNPF